MPKLITLLTVALLLASATAQTPEAMDRWMKSSGDALMPFLPNASPAGMTVDPAPAFSGPANETYEYKGADSMVHKYPSYVVHQTWWINDSELSRQTAELERDKKKYNDESSRALEEFLKSHDADMKAWNKAQQEAQANLSKQIEALVREGKYDEAGKLADKNKMSPYPPYQALTDSLKKQQDELDSRERKLTGLRRNVEFQIQTNRTPTTTATAFHPKPTGTLAGHPLFRQLRGNPNMGDRIETLVDLAVFLAPPGYENPQTKIGTRELTTKSIVVWAFIESRPDKIEADEASARKVLESINYEGLSRLLK